METLPRFDLKGQVALVTGAARGLGHAISLALAAAGADVALGLRDVNSDGGLSAEIRALGRRALPIQMDVMYLDQITHAVDDTVRHFGRLDILVNNAGVAPGNPVENVREEDFDLTLAVNLKGTFFASQAAGRVMIRQKRGCIINMSSQAGFAVRPSVFYPTSFPHPRPAGGGCNSGKRTASGWMPGAPLGGLDEEGLLQWEETFLDGSFAPAKKGAPQSVKPSAARARSGWYWSTVEV
ncbi:MAG TPA: SDR family NAD(P)-dependent oxidoreductase [Terriglobales bacterium]